MTEKIFVTVVNHLAVDITASPDAVWHAILDEFVDGKKLWEVIKVEPIDDPCAVLGGYRMRREHEGIVDERVIHFTERDDAARRLSIFADCLTIPAGGMKVWVTYQAQEIPGGARYAIDCHSRPSIEAPASGAKADIASVIAEMKAGSDTALLAYLGSVKARLESAGFPGSSRRTGVAEAGCVALGKSSQV